MDDSQFDDIVRRLEELRSRKAVLSDDQEADWGSDDHISSLEARLADMAYWRDKNPKGSEKRSHYRNIYSALKKELQSARSHRAKLNEKQKLTEGGLVGHLQHLYDNRDITFGEIKKILRSAASGRLEKVTEKMDGMNLVFSYDSGTGNVLAARNSGDIAGGGVTASQLAAKFAGRGSVEEAFNTAFKVLQGAIGALPQKARTKVFGPSANRWYSMEVIYTKNPNVINYDSDNVVFHGWPVFRRDRSGQVEQVEDEVGGVDVLAQYIERMQAAVKATGWKVRGPSIVRLAKLSDGSILQDAVSALDAAMAAAGSTDRDTVGTYLRSLMEDAAADLKLDPQTTKMVVDRCMGEPGSPTLVDIKKRLDKLDQVSVVQFVRSSPELLKAFVRPLELAINDFAVELLKGLGSTLISDSSKEVARLRAEVSKAVAAIQSSGNETAMAVLRQQMEKLGSVENITSPVEGVVFLYKGNAYKFTGSFASAGQILGIFRYGRGATKLKMSNE